MSRLGVIETVTVHNVAVRPGMFLVCDSNPTGFYFIDYKYRCHWTDTDGDLNRCVEAGGENAKERNWAGWRVVDGSKLLEKP